MMWCTFAVVFACGVTMSNRVFCAFEELCQRMPLEQMFAFVNYWKGESYTHKYDKNSQWNTVQFVIKF